MDTIGSLIDKLVTIRLKQHNLKEGDSFSDRSKYEDLESQSECIIKEIDKTFDSMILCAVVGSTLDNFIQRKHKTL